MLNSTRFRFRLGAKGADLRSVLPFAITGMVALSKPASIGRNRGAVKQTLVRSWFDLHKLGVTPFIPTLAANLKSTQSLLPSNPMSGRFLFNDIADKENRLTDFQGPWRDKLNLMQRQRFPPIIK
jgi:hypothetical protein